MIHAADKRLGNLTEKGQHWKSETVAELGGAVLLKVLGYDLDADLGGCWRYIEQYAETADIEPLAACQKVLKRMFAEEVTAEYFVKTEGRSRKVDEWKMRPEQSDNHWLDCLVGSEVAASIQGAVLFCTGAALPNEKKRLKLSELQRSKR